MEEEYAQEYQRLEAGITVETDGPLLTKNIAVGPTAIIKFGVKLEGKLNEISPPDASDCPI